MSVNSQKNNLAYGLSNALQNLNPLSIIAKRAPSSKDFGEIGQQWIYNDQVWMFTSSATWTELAAAANTGIFTSLTVNGASAFNGAITATTLNNAITLSSGTAATNIGADAAAKTITIGNVTGATGVVIRSGTGNSSIDSTGSVLVGATAPIVTVGNATAATATSLLGGATGGIIINANSTGNILLTPKSTSSNSYAFTNNSRVGSQSIVIPVNIAINAVISIVMTNSFLNNTLETPVVCTVTTNDTGGGLLQIQGMIIGNNTLTISAKNIGSALINSATNNIIVSFIVLN